MPWTLQLVIGGYGINQGGGVEVMVVMMVTVEMMVMVVMVIGGYGTNHSGGVVAKMMDQQKNLQRLRSIPCLLLRQNVSFCVLITPRGMEGFLT